MWSVLKWSCCAEMSDSAILKCPNPHARIRIVILIIALHRKSRVSSPCESAHKGKMLKPATL